MALAEPILDQITEPPIGLALRDWYGLTTAEGDVLACLMRAAGAAAPSSTLAGAAAISLQSAPPIIFRLRRALKIESAPGPVYSLAEPSVAKCRNVLRIYGRSLLTEAERE